MLFIIFPVSPFDGYRTNGRRNPLAARYLPINQYQRKNRHRYGNSPSSKNLRENKETALAIPVGTSSNNVASPAAATGSCRIALINRFAAALRMAVKAMNVGSSANRPLRA
jgi:hypothetical protein